MSFLLKDSIHTALAEIFYNDIISRRSNYYYYIGKIVDWSEPILPDDPTETGSYEYETRNDIISIKKILPQDISYVIPRYNWESGEVYDQYDPDYSPDFPSSTGKTSLKQSKFYVLSAYQGTYYNVYKCLSNNNGAASTERPSGSDPVSLTYLDGYVWKYMYTIPLNLRNKFLTKDYIPVSKAVLNPYYSNGEISSIVIDSAGSGYTSNTVLTLSINSEYIGKPGNVAANIKPVLNETGQFIDIIVTNAGNNIKSANIIVNDYSGHGESYYKAASNVVLHNAGSGYTLAAIANTTATVTTTGTQPNTNATVALTFTNSMLTDISLVDVGSGYTRNIASNTSIVIATTGSSQPTSNATANIYFNVNAEFQTRIVNNKLQDVFILDPGIHYTNNSRTIINLIGDGEGAKLVPFIQNGQLTDVIIENRGSGYTYLDIDVVGDGSGANAYASFYVGDMTTIQSTVELSAIDGAIHNVRIVDAGDSYSNANISIHGDGTGFVGNVIIENNIISKINVINPGRNYTYANVIIDGDGANSVVTAILSPQGGHGADPVKELFSDTLIIYSTINNEKNQGIFVNNDYRQFGLIRDVRKFDNNERYEDSIGSSCYLANLKSKVSLTVDDELSLVADESIKFDVVSIDSSTNKVLLNGKNNFALTSQDILINLETDQTYSIFEISAEPDINKFTGDLLFTDNRTTISDSDQQLVTLKTVLKL